MRLALAIAVIVSALFCQQTWALLFSSSTGDLHRPL